MKSKLNKIGNINIIPLAVILTGIVILSVSYMEKSLEKSVISGEKSLSCFINDKWKEIDADKVKYQINGKWVFENGYSGNCKVEDAS